MDPRVSDSRIKLVKGDTGPPIQLTLTSEATGLPIDLTGATVTAHFKSVATGSFVFSRALSVSAPATQGIAVIAWGATDLNQTPGDYNAEVEILFSGGVRQTVYDLVKFRIRDQIA